jgi:hypothetical protein
MTAPARSSGREKTWIHSRKEVGPHIEEKKRDGQLERRENNYPIDFGKINKKINKKHIFCWFRFRSSILTWVGRWVYYNLLFFFFFWKQLSATFPWWNVKQPNERPFHYIFVWF